MKSDLYEKDYYLWIEKTISLLENHQFSDLDLDNLIEEISDMGKSQRQSLKSYLTRLLEHLLKLVYWQSELEYNQRGWKNEIRNFRLGIQQIIEDSPSLKPYLAEIFSSCYQNARKLFLDLSGMAENLVGLAPICTIEQALNEDWFPEISK
ncbi:MAG: DUF29 domain-containing protein [Microcystis sp. M114S2]|jgi:hypothetical protein|uniref:DUF29 domain-containing protein n=2 Tax=Microcystis aeruginosa TaxID=1126 RepID=A0A510PFB6_MICAE|nr:MULTISPECIES: DUF29 domain-containing protein [Microcystis]MCA2668494.1 DUF29 domain-containing protein [Microcystis sp. M045S2]MCA2713511.1 DUF29 domain-containing protein [Microcystis sp. M172S2]MCA2804168.1 DUF29 domain-containing protein [Microcystis sp. M114S2]MCA2833861.1 DUF29 domain-containing protein [Microcystis sp. M007S1]MCA2836705.1 DUF29 domain-containing protein [Microcystis sp. M078S1]